LVGSQEVFTQTQADHQRATAAGSNQTIRLFGADHGQTVRTVQLFNSGFEGSSQVVVVFEFVLKQVGNDFSISVRSKNVTQAFKLLAQGFMVFDDTVMNHSQIGTGEMRVSVTLARRAVSCPTGVSDAQSPCQWFTGQRLLKLSNFTVAAHAFQGAVVGENSNTCTVVATVFKSFQAFKQNGRDVAFSDCAYNSAHKILLA